MITRWLVDDKPAVLWKLAFHVVFHSFLTSLIITFAELVEHIHEGSPEMLSLKKIQVLKARYTCFRQFWKTVKRKFLLSHASMWIVNFVVICQFSVNRLRTIQKGCMCLNKLSYSILFHSVLFCSILFDAIRFDSKSEFSYYVVIVLANIRLTPSLMPVFLIAATTTNGSNSYVSLLY